MTLTNERLIETWYYRADELLENNEYAEAKELLLTLLEEEPTYAKAHNILGWLYTHKLHDLQKAEVHLKLGIKYGEGYAAPIMNFAILLYEANRYDELMAFVHEHLNTWGIDQAYLLALKGHVFETRRDYKAALNAYEEAKRYVFNTEYLNRLTAHKERVYLKMGKIARVLAMF
jgi:tetratricopeptide (TPR) repeat protein